MEYGTIEREIHVEASPEVVYDVVSRPEHIREWFPDEVDLEPTPGATGSFTWRGSDPDSATSVPVTVVDADPPRLFSFRWTHAEGESAASDNSLLVTIELEPVGSGTRLRLTETGFRERGWEAAVLEAQYNDHMGGWDVHVARLSDYVARLVAAS